MMEWLVTTSQSIIAIIKTDVIYIALMITVIPLFIATWVLLWMEIIKPIWYCFCHISGWILEKIEYRRTYEDY